MDWFFLKKKNLGAFFLDLTIENSSKLELFSVLQLWSLLIAGKEKNLTLLAYKEQKVIGLFIQNEES